MLELAFSTHLVLFKGGQCIVIQILVKGVVHHVNGGLVSSMTVAGMMLGTWSSGGFGTLVAIWECNHFCEILLILICVDHISVELRVLANYLTFNILITVDLFDDFVEMRLLSLLFG